MHRLHVVVERVVVASMVYAKVMSTYAQAMRDASKNNKSASDAIAKARPIMDEILRLAGEGMAVLFISSEIDEVVRVSNRIAVLRDRRKVGELPGGSDEQDVYHLIAAQA